MARKKVKLQWIVNDTARRTTYKKRVKGLMKKATELSVLCGVEACTVIYSPYEPQPEVWPSPAEVARVMAGYKCRPENDQTKKKLDQENYTRQRLAKANAQVEKQQRKNRRMEMENLVNRCLAQGDVSPEMGIEQCSDLTWSIDDRLRAVRYRMELLGRPEQQRPPAGGGGGCGSGEKTALAAALESLESQMLMEAATPGFVEGQAAGGGGQEMMVPAGGYEDIPSFWGTPFLYEDFGGGLHPRSGDRPFMNKF